MEAPLAQRLVARATKASRRLARKDKKVKNAEHVSDVRMYRDNEVQRQKTISLHYRREKTVRREEWEFGPRLAPRRDIGQKRTTFGTVDRERIYPGVVPERQRKKAHVAVGDRVLVMKGPDRGKIGNVTEIEEDRQVVMVEGMNQYSYTIPDFVTEEENVAYRPTMHGSRPLHFKDVRLVATLRNASGVSRDVVVDNIELRAGKRWVPALGQEVGWPEVPEKNPDDAQDTDADTFRLTVDDPTFTPTLQRPPMPPSIIDELRNKYSKFRTRHEPEYLAQKEAEIAAIRQRKQQLEVLGMSPMERASALHKATRGEPRQLTVEQLAAIGRVIADAKARDKTSEALS